MSPGVGLLRVCDRPLVEGDRVGARDGARALDFARGASRGIATVCLAWPSGDGSCLLYTSPSPRDLSTSRMPSSA